MKNSLFAFLVFAALLLVLSCNKSSLLGSEFFADDKLNLTFSDTLISINAETENPDSVPALDLRSSLSQTFFTKLPVGKMLDPVFGLTEARAYVGFTTASTINLDSTAEYELDSVVWVMSYAGAEAYGDTTKFQKLVISQMKNELLDNFIYSNRREDVNATPLARFDFIPYPNSPVVFRKDTIDYRSRPHIRIKLDKSFGEPLVNPKTYLASGPYGGDITKYFKGFEMKMENATNAMVSFNIADDSTGIYIHYKKKFDTVPRTYQFRPIKGSFPSFNHNYTVGTIDRFFNGKKIARGDSLLFAQGMAGANIRLEFPNLSKLGALAFNRVELEMTVQEDSADKYLPNEQFVITTAKGEIVADLLTQGEYTSFGGGLNTEGGGIRRYRFNISNHIHKMYRGTGGTAIYIIPDNRRGSIPNKQETTRRTVIYGPKHSKYPMKLNVYYTKV
jgi:hypothetical protein